MSHMYLRNFKLPTNPSSQTGVIAEDKKEDMSRFFSELADSSDLATLGRPPAPPTQSPFCNLFYPNPSQYPSVPETKLPFDENYDEHIGLQKQQKKLTPAYIKKLSIDCILKELNPPSDSLDVGKSNNGQLVYHAHRNIRISE